MHTGHRGNTVGAPLAGRVLIIDDVITAGTSAGYSIDLIRANGAETAGFVISLDRQERAPGSEHSALQNLSGAHDIPVFSIASLTDLIELLGSDGQEADILEQVVAYRSEYGCD